MLTSRVALLVVCLAASSLFAQVPRPELEPRPDAPVVGAASPVLTGTNPENTPQADRELNVFAPAVSAPRKIGSNADVTGANGALLLEGAPADGVILRANSTLRFQTAGVDRMWIWNDGHVSIGGPYNQGRLSALDYGDGGRAFLGLHHAYVETTTPSGQIDYGVMVASQEEITAGVTNNGAIVGAQIEGWNLGPGTATYLTGINILAGNHVIGQPSSAITNATGLYIQVQKGQGTVTNGKALYIADVMAANDYAIYQTGADDTNFLAGNTIVGTLPAVAGVYALEVNGHANFNGTVTGTNIKAHYQDVAEWVPATSDLSPGTVVILNREKNNEVMASATSYDTTVAGVVSAQPGLSLGIEGEGKEQIATTGRVKVRVDARVKAIRVGDLLVTSDLPGTAMRSEPMDINGRQFHQPGTIIGKALEPLEGGVGDILVLLSMQ